MPEEKWVQSMKKADFQAIGREFHIDPVIARIIRNRDVEGQEAIRKFLYGSWDDLYSPWDMKDMDKAVSVIEKKLREGAVLRIIGDYDIDGVCATYILKRALKKLGAKVDYRIPDRIKDGYGINEAMIRQAAADGVDTILTCDNGISAGEQIRLANELGLTVVVTDHHEVPFTRKETGEIQYLIPDAAAVVDPKQADCPYPYKGLCGAAVAYKAMEALYGHLGRDRAELRDMMQFVAMATVGDVMDLTDENRILLRLGLELIHHTDHVGLSVLCSACGLDRKDVSPYHIGFVLGPCLNATGRLDSAARALRLLEAERWEDAIVLAQELRDLNDSRKTMTAANVEAAMELVESRHMTEDRVLVVYLPGCHESLAGIVAGRLREHYGKPTFVLTKGEDGVKGSGRSIEAYSMFEKLQECRDLLTRFGGHPMAAGLSMKEEYVDELRRRLNEQSGLKPEDYVVRVSIDVPMPMHYVTEGFVEQLEVLAPFGKANPRPLFAQRSLRVTHYQAVGKNRNVMKLSLADGRGTYNAVYFGETEAMEKFLEEHDVITVVYYPEINEYMGRRSLQFVIRHYR